MTCRRALPAAWAVEICLFPCGVAHGLALRFGLDAHRSRELFDFHMKKADVGWPAAGIE